MIIYLKLGGKGQLFTEKKRRSNAAALQHDKYPGGLSFTSYCFFLIIALKWEFPAFVKHHPCVEIALQAIKSRLK